MLLGVFSLFSFLGWCVFYITATSKCFSWMLSQPLNVGTLALYQTLRDGRDFSSMISPRLYRLWNLSNYCKLAIIGLCKASLNSKRLGKNSVFRKKVKKLIGLQSYLVTEFNAHNLQKNWYGLEITSVGRWKTLALENWKLKDFSLKLF